MSGLNLTATEKLSITVFNNSKVEARIFDTPKVEVKVFNNSNTDLTVKGVDYLDVNVFNGGRACLQGAAYTVAVRESGGEADVTGLKAGHVIRHKNRR